MKRQKSYGPGSGCSNIGQCYPPDKSLSGGYIYCKCCKNQWCYPLDSDLSNWVQEHILKYQVLWADCEEDKPIALGEIKGQEKRCCHYCNPNLSILMDILHPGWKRGCG